VADAVIFDSPPAAVVTDAAVLASKADGVILIIEAGRTRLGEARQALFNLQQAGANILGGIINRASTKNGGYYYYHAYYASHPPGNGDSKPEQFGRQFRHWWRHWLPFFR
jgi:Mrp family chromosome partitioning ATPase